MPARMKGHFICRSCGDKVALNHFSLDGYLCGSCGILQKFGMREWSQIVRHAHDTADITGFFRPSADDVRFWEVFSAYDSDVAMMFKSIGRDKSCLTKGNEEFGGIEFEMDVSPGHPLCASCSKPVKLEIKAERLHCTCLSCGYAAIYRAFPEAGNYRNCVAAICEDDRSDVSTAKTEPSSGGGAIAITCPNCAGALDVRALGDTVTCPFCKTMCHVPAQVFTRAMGKAIPPRPWWMVFEGESRRRIRINNTLKQQADAARQNEERLRKREELAQQSRLKRKDEAARRRKTLLKAGMIIAVVIGVIAVAVLIVS